MTRQKYRHWTHDEEEELLQLLKDGYKIKQIATALGRTEQSTRGRYNILRLTGAINFPTPGVIPKLTKEQKDEAFRLRKEKRLSYGKIAEIVGCSETSAARACKEYINAKPDLAMSTLNWTAKEDAQLRRLANNNVPNGEIAARMGRSIYAIKKRRNELKIGHHRKPKPTLKHQPVFKPSGNPWLDIVG